MIFPIDIFFQGLALGAGLIIAIGSQNAFVLRQGLKRDKHFIVASACFLSDAFLILVGGLGVGTIIASTPWLGNVAAIGGAIFLGVYGGLAFRRALHKETLSVKNVSAKPMAVKSAIFTALGFSLLNPHAFLDTVVLLGGISGQHDWPDRAWFIGGAMMASFFWFYALAYGAGKLAPLFNAPITWRILDGAIAIIMWWIAFVLIMDRFF
ncbi:MAG: LysE/ArgO family amino acid transporter [Rhodospirillaceae bacterium]|nr:LysE/ArgO family amino acid transporter [Rhodospirillaceae bacterium]